MAQFKLEKNTTKTEAVVSKVRTWFGWFGVTLIALTYMVFSFLKIIEKDATILEIILRTAISFLVGFSINRMLDIQGINTGIATPEFKEVESKHYEATRKLGRDRKKLRNYTKDLNVEALKEARMSILTYAGLDYDEYFDEKGKLIGDYEVILIKNKKMTPSEKSQIEVDNKIRKNINKHIKWAVSHKVTQVTPQSLLSDDVKVLDPNYQGRTLREYNLKSVGIDVIAKLAPALVVGRLAVAFTDKAGWASFVLALVEISIYIVFGFVKYYTAYNFVTLQYKQRIVNKTLQLEGLKDWEEEVILEELPEVTPVEVTEVVEETKDETINMYELKSISI